MLAGALLHSNNGICRRAPSATSSPLFPRVRAGVVKNGSCVAIIVVPLKSGRTELEDSLALFALMSLASFSVSEAITID